MICVECKGRTCIRCDIIWHPSETCEEVAARRAEARDEKETAATTKYLTKNVKVCPRCNVRGEKVSGCDHMICKIQYCYCNLCSSLYVTLPLGPRCKAQYCWLCLADYREIRRIGNTAHQEGCRYHSDRLPNTPDILNRPLAAAELTAEQAARARPATPDSLDGEMELATEDDNGANNQATEDMNNGTEQVPQAPRIELHHRGRNRNMARVPIPPLLLP